MQCLDYGWLVVRDGSLFLDCLHCIFCCVMVLFSPSMENKFRFRQWLFMTRRTSDFIFPCSVCPQLFRLCVWNHRSWMNWQYLNMLCKIQLVLQQRSILNVQDPHEGNNLWVRKHLLPCIAASSEVMRCYYFIAVQQKS